MRKLAYLTPIILLLFGTSTYAQWIGVGLPGPDYYDANDYMNAVPGQFGQFGAGYQTVAGVPLLNGSLTQNASYFSDFMDYANGTYTVSFTAPNPSAVTIAPSLDLSNLTNVTISGNTWTGTVTLKHDSGGITAGSSMLNISGVTAANPVSNFTVYATGTNPSAMTPAYQNLVKNYASLYTLNTNDIVGNQNTVDVGDLPSNGSVYGNVSVHDLVVQANSLPKLQNMIVEVPVGATNAALAAIGKQLNALNPNVKVIVAVGGETWNGAQGQFGAVLKLAKANPAVAAAASDDYTRVAYESAVLDVNAINQIRAASSNTNITGYLVSQGSNTYFVDREKSWITGTMGLKLSSIAQYQGVSMYSDDGLTTPQTTAQGLYNSLIADLPRVTGYVKADAADAHASGLNEIIYEFGMSGELTQSGTSNATLAAFNASPLSGQWATADIQAALGALSAGDGMEVFTGGLWGPQPDTLAPVTNEQAAINQFLVGAPGATPVPEPTFSACFLLLGLACVRNRRIGTAIRGTFARA